MQGNWFVNFCFSKACLRTFCKLFSLYSVLSLKLQNLSFYYPSKKIIFFINNLWIDMSFLNKVLDFLASHEDASIGGDLKPDEI